MEKQVSNRIQGLSYSEVRQRVYHQQVNTAPDSLTRSISQIIMQNTFTLFNFINIFLAFAILSVSKPKNILFLGVVIINTSIGIFQEIRAKKKIDSLSLLSRSKVTVLREGIYQEIHQEDVVLDDILLLTPGKEVCADSILLQEDKLEVDESQLTGESHAVPKKTEDTVYSGSFIIAGEGLAKVTAVGNKNYVAKLTQEAKTEKKIESDLTRALNIMIRYLTFAIFPIGIILFYTQYKTEQNLSISILGSSAAVLSMIPEGLILLTSIAFAVSAGKLAQQKILVQSLPCIETLARSDVLCLDKTGTITDGSLSVAKVINLTDQPDMLIKEYLAQMIHVFQHPNETALAIQNYVQKPDLQWELDTRYPFSSQKKWSGASFQNKGTLLLGAAEFLPIHLEKQIQETLTQLMNEGYRVLVLAHHTQTFSKSIDSDIEFTPYAIITLQDTIRDHASDTFQFLVEQGMTLKLISGDHPNSVSAIAQKVNIPNSDQWIDLSHYDDALSVQECLPLVQQYTVFGRVTPEQKKNLVLALQQLNQKVCMTGDGVNDVLALKEADVSIAMASGSDAARTVSDIVLLNSDLSSMIDILKEGRRVINNIERVASMYLVKTIYSVILAIFFIFMNMSYPFTPLQLSPINSLTVGIPSFFLALKPSYQKTSGHFKNNILEISLPAALTIVINIILVQIIGKYLGYTHATTSTIAVLLTGTVGFLVLLEVSHPLDWKKKLMLITLVTGFISIFIFLQSFFSLVSLFNRRIFLYGPLLLMTPLLFLSLKRLVFFIRQKLLYYRKAQ